MEDEVPRPFAAPPRPDWAARWHEWRADRRVGAALLACVAVATGFAWLRSGPGSSSAALPPPVTTGRSGGSFVVTTSTTKPTVASVVVDVVGAVRRGGVVHLRGGSRVIDAIAAAGGATADADLTRLNLAAPVADGTRVAVPRLGAPAPAVDPAAVSDVPSAAGGADGTPSASAPLNLNSATADQLDALPGVGPATAAAIVKDREAHGPFRSVNDLGRVRGIGDVKLAALRDLVTV